jgi:AraC family transcriptional regulator
MIDLKDLGHEPSSQEMSSFVSNRLFDEFTKHLGDEYKANCKIEYSKDTWTRGWNIKFKKSGKSLCVIYPKERYFTVLVVISKKEKERVGNIWFQLSKGMQDIYRQTKEGNEQRWLMIDLKANDDVYQDVLKLIQIRWESK